MATLQAATSSTGAIVSGPQTVRELRESCCFGTFDQEVTKKGETGPKLIASLFDRWQDIVQLRR